MTSSEIRILENQCRTCMGEQQHTKVIPQTATKQMNKFLISIYHEHELKVSGNIKILELLKQTTPQLTVETDDMLPKTICVSCLDKLVDIHEFQNKSLRVEQRLRDIIKEYNSPRKKDVDPLNNNKRQPNKHDIDEPSRDVATSVKGSFSLLQKDGDKIYNNLETCYGETNGRSEISNTAIGNKSKLQLDTAAVSFSEARNNENDNSDVKFWKYIVGDGQNLNSVTKEQKSYEEGFVNGEVMKDLYLQNREETTLYKITREFKKSITAIEIPTGVSDVNHKRKGRSEDEYVNERRRQAKVIISNDMENVAEEETFEREVTDCSEISVDDESDREPLSYKLERLRDKSTINNIKAHDKQQQDNLDPKNEDEKIVSVNLDTRGYSCNKCDKRLKTRLSLKMHLKRHLKKEQKQHSVENGHICPECGIRLKTRVTFRRHMLKHEKDETKIKYKCQYCNKVFSQSGALRYHARTHTGERPYLCSICGKSFATQCSLKQHYGRHGTAFNYQCPQCPKQFRCSSSMSTHKAIVHSIARPHVCDVCGASFKKPYSLTKHKIIHGEKKHKCDYCEMKFAQPDQCRRHMRTHTGEKPYKCRYCERAYAQSNDMIKHLRVHLGNNVYRCELCPQAFRLLCEMRAHFTSHLNDDEETKQQNLKALQEEEQRIQAKIERAQATEQQS